MTWKYFPRYWPFEKGIRRSPVDHKGPAAVTRSSEYAVEQTMELQMIWDTMVLIVTSL